MPFAATSINKLLYEKEDYWNLQKGAAERMFLENMFEFGLVELQLYVFFQITEEMRALRASDPAGRVPRDGAPAPPGAGGPRWRRLCCVGRAPRTDQGTQLRAGCTRTGNGLWQDSRREVPSYLSSYGTRARNRKVLH